MKKIVLFLAALVSLLAFSGCTDKSVESTDSSTKVSSSQKAESTATITLLDGEKELSKKEITFDKGENLYNVLKKNYAVEDDDGMITSIDGHAQDAKQNKYWVFTKNDEQVNVGAKDVELKEGDRVVFKLEQF